jgi:transposase
MAAVVIVPRGHFYPGPTMTDGQWALLAPLLPTAGGGGGGRPEVWSRRLVLDAIFYLVRGVDPRAGVVPDLPSAA